MTEYNITIKDVTDNVQVDSEFKVTGDGVLDDLMETLTTHLTAQYDAGRIVGNDYATVYLGMIQAVLAQSIQFVMGVPQAQEQATLTSAKTDLTKEQLNTELLRQGLLDRQTKGFDDDAKQKLLKQVLDSWSVGFSVSQSAVAIPDSVKVNVIDSICKNAMDNLGIDVTNDPIGEP
jgi:hypothetical protein